MQTHLFRILLLFVFLGVLPVGCCGDTPFEYLKLSKLDLELAESSTGFPLVIGSRLASGALTSAPEVAVTVRLQFDAVAAVKSDSPFLGQASAFQCPEAGWKGLKEDLEVTAVDLTSTGLFNGVAAGQSLQQFVRCNKYSSLIATPSAQLNEFPLAQLADSLSVWELGELNYPFYLRVSPKPADNARQQFRLRFRLKNGQEIVQETPAIVWD